MVLNNGVPADGVPIAFQLIGGAGVDGRIVATQDGRASLAAQRVFGSSVRLRIRVDLATLASVAQRENAWLKRQFGREMISLGRDVAVDLASRPVTLRGEADEALRAALAKRLGLTIGTTGSWTVAVSSEDLGCRDLSMRRTCAAQGTLSLLDGGTPIASASAKVRGTASSDDDASAQVERRLPGRLIKELIRDLTGN
jgi:hypothetical protein